MPHHAEAAMWTEGRSRRWFARCDQCGKRRLVADYYEVYPPLDGPPEERGWWWACAYCMMSIINDRFDALMKRMETAITNWRPKKMPNQKKITVHLTRLQLAAAEEACDEASDEMLIDMTPQQRRSTKGAAEVLRRAIKE